MKANRFRYRAWHKPSRTMCGVAALYSDAKPDMIGATLVFENVPTSREPPNTYVKEGETHTEYRDCFNRDIEPLQSTGLEDSEGREIFEGDIVFSQRYAAKYTVDWVEYLCSFQTVEHESDEGYSESMGKGYGSDELAVIGNIYENSELVRR